MTHLPNPDYQPEFYASVPAKRFVAWVFDSLVILLVCVLALPFTAFLGLFFFPLLYLTIGFVYRTATIAAGSSTWGMRFTGIELRNNDGARFDTGQALAHTAGYTISMAFPILQVISVIMMLTGARGQGLTDNLLGTVAINRRALA